MGKSIVNAHSFKMDLSLPLHLTPDSCWIQHLRAFTGKAVTPTHALTGRRTSRETDTELINPRTDRLHIIY